MESTHQKLISILLNYLDPSLSVVFSLLMTDHMSQKTGMVNISFSSRLSEGMRSSISRFFALISPAFGVRKQNFTVFFWPYLNYISPTRLLVTEVAENNTQSTTDLTRYTENIFLIGLKLLWRQLKRNTCRDCNCFGRSDRFTKF